jgi:hypothetical protein
MAAVALILLLSVFVVGLTVMLLSIATAREGYEDERGFHFGPPPCGEPAPYTDRPLARKQARQSRRHDSATR